MTIYETHRKIGAGSWVKIATRPEILKYYIDWEIYISRLYRGVYYKIRSLNGTRTSDSFSNVIVIGEPPSFGKYSDESSLVNNKQYVYQLEQNYPNPFNPTTVISFSLKDDSFVTLRVFDILGREVAMLLSERIESGLHQVQFDGSNLESGIYFYEIRANDFRDVKKFILQK